MRGCAISRSPGPCPLGSRRCRGNLRGEITIRPVDAFAKRVAVKAGDLDRRAGALLCRGKRLSDGRLWIVDEGLRQENDFLVEFAQAAFDHLLDDRRWLAGLFYIGRA